MIAVAALAAALAIAVTRLRRARAQILELDRANRRDADVFQRAIARANAQARCPSGACKSLAECIRNSHLAQQAAIPDDELTAPPMTDLGKLIDRTATA